MVDLVETLLTTPSGQLFTVALFIVVSGLIFLVWSISNANMKMAASITKQSDGMLKTFDEMVSKTTTALEKLAESWVVHNTQASEWRLQSSNAIHRLANESATIALQTSSQASILSDLSRTETELRERIDSDVLTALAPIENQVLPGIAAINVSLKTIQQMIQDVLDDCKPDDMSKELAEVSILLEKIIEMIDEKGKPDEYPKIEPKPNIPAADDTAVGVPDSGAGSSGEPDTDAA